MTKGSPTIFYKVVIKYLFNIYLNGTIPESIKKSKKYLYAHDLVLDLLHDFFVNSVVTKTMLYAFKC